MRSSLKGTLVYCLRIKVRFLWFDLVVNGQNGNKCVTVKEIFHIDFDARWNNKNKLTQQSTARPTAFGISINGIFRYKVGLNNPYYKRREVPIHYHKYSRSEMFTTFPTSASLKVTSRSRIKMLTAGKSHLSREMSCRYYIHILSMFCSNILRQSNAK